MTIPRYLTLFNLHVDLQNIDCRWFAVDATVWLYYLSALSLWFGMGWWPCAACVVFECTNCTDSTPQFQIDIDGVANEDCTTGCTDINSTYVVTGTCQAIFACHFHTDSTVNATEPCDRSHVSISTACAGVNRTTPYLSLQLTKVISNLLMDVRYQYEEGGSSPSFDWFKTVISWDENCETLDEALGVVTDPNECDISASTCQVTAL